MKRKKTNKTSSKVCPNCKTDMKREQNMVLMLSPCMHVLCKTCVNFIFSNSLPNKCPSCERQVSKEEFTVKIFDDILLEKEIFIRKRVVSVFNKTLADFASNENAETTNHDHIEEYNKYLEFVEEIIYNLLNDTNVEHYEKVISEQALSNAAANIQNAKLTNLNTDEYKSLMDSEMGILRNVYNSEPQPDLTFDDIHIDEVSNLKPIDNQDDEIKQDKILPLGIERYNFVLKLRPQCIVGGFSEKISIKKAIYDASLDLFND